MSSDNDPNDRQRTVAELLAEHGKHPTANPRRRRRRTEDAAEETAPQAIIARVRADSGAIPRVQPPAEQESLQSQPAQYEAAADARSMSRQQASRQHPSAQSPTTARRTQPHPSRSEPQRSEPRRSEPQRDEPQRSESQREGPQRSEAQRYSSPVTSHPSITPPPTNVPPVRRYSRPPGSSAEGRNVSPSPRSGAPGVAAQPNEPRTEQLPAVPAVPEPHVVPPGEPPTGSFRPTSTRRPETAGQSRFGEAIPPDKEYGHRDSDSSRQVMPTEDQDDYRDDYQDNPAEDFEAQRDEDLEAEEAEANQGYDGADNDREWLTLVGLITAGVVGGAGVWLGFDWLWGVLPTAALVTALVVIAAMVWVIRRIRPDEERVDIQTMVLVVLVGLVVTVSPAALLMLRH